MYLAARALPAHPGRSPPVGITARSYRTCHRTVTCDPRMTPETPTSSSSPRVPERRPFPARAVGVAVGLLVAGLLTTVLTGIPVALVVGALGYGLESSAFTVGVFVANGLAFGIVGAVYVHRWLGGVSISVPRRDLGLVAVVVALSVAFALAVQVAAEALLGGSVSTLVGETIVADRSFYLVYALLSVLVIAPAEELLFRGAIQGRLRRSFGARGAIVGASLLFALPHLGNFAGGLGWAVLMAGTLFVVSAVWGWLYERTENLAVPIVAHGLYNAGLAAVSYLSYVGVF